MRRFIDGLGWILFLLLAAVALVFYNTNYHPQAMRINRLRTEIAMWTEQVQALRDSLADTAPAADTAFSATLLVDVLFPSTESLRLSTLGEQTLRSYIPQIQATTGRIFVIGHTDNSPVPASLRNRYPTNWELGAARATAVASTLVAWGVPSTRIRVVSAAATEAVTTGTTPASLAGNNRVQILVCGQ